MCSLLIDKGFPTTISLRKKFPYLELFRSKYFHIRTEYGEILHISPYSVRIRENADQNNSECGHFSRSIFEVVPEWCFYTCLSNLFSLTDFYPMIPFDLLWKHYRAFGKKPWWFINNENHEVVFLSLDLNLVTIWRSYHFRSSRSQMFRRSSK